MSTPITVRQREQAIQRRRAQEQQFPRASSNQNSERYQHYQPNQRIQQRNQWQYRQPQNFAEDNVEDSAAYRRFDWDDWTMQQPSTTTPRNSYSTSDYAQVLGPCRILELNFHLNSDYVVSFNNAESPFSTFHKTNIRISGVQYPSVENYYQACKIYALIGSYAVWNMKNLKDGFAAKKHARSVVQKAKIDPKTVEAWKNTKGVQAVFYGTYYKFKQNPKLRQILFQTRNNLIIHDYKNDKIYSSGCEKEKLLNWLADNDGKLLHVVFDMRDFNNNSFPVIAEGHNIVGYVTMMVREKLKGEYPQEYEAAQNAPEESQSRRNRSPPENIDGLIRGIHDI